MARRECRRALARSLVMKRRLCGLALAALAIGVFALVYRGPGRVLVRGHAGDVAATMLVFAILGLAWRVRPAVRAVATMAIATAIELGQTVWQARSFAGELLVGGTFDAIDFIAYAIGLAIALAVELARPRPISSTARPASPAPW